jgi:hypothetical protein
MSEERVIAVFREAGASEEELGQVRKGLSLLKGGFMTPEDAYYYLIGLARERLIPLTPKQVGDLREALGLPRSFSR